MNRPASPPHLRWAITRTTALREALNSLLGHHGPNVHLDLRANAYGLGAQSVATVAAELGFRHATCDPGVSEAGLVTDDSPPDAQWLSLAHEHHAQLLQARVVNSKKVDAGAEVSYGGEYQTTRATHLALVAIGFADGVPRLHPVGGMVDAHGQRYPIAGRITMDQLIVDTGDTALSQGDIVTVWGGAVSAHEWSTWSHRSLEIIGSGLGTRVEQLAGGEKR